MGLRSKRARVGTTVTRTRTAHCCRSRSRSSRTRGSARVSASVNFATDGEAKYAGYLSACLHLRQLQLPEVRHDASLLAARAGQRGQDRPRSFGSPGTPGRRRPRILADALRHLRAGRHAALPPGPGHQPPPVGAQRGRPRDRRRPRVRRADHRAAPHAPAGRDPGPRQARHAELTSRPAAARMCCATTTTARSRASCSSRARAWSRTLISLLALAREGRPQRQGRLLRELRALHAPGRGLPRVGPDRRRSGATRCSLPTRACASAATGSRRAGWRKYALTPDHDNRWRTGGSLDDIVEESHFDPHPISAEGIARYAKR
jgi:hypothetical protein